MTSGPVVPRDEADGLLDGRDIGERRAAELPDFERALLLIATVTLPLLIVTTPCAATRSIARRTAS